MAKLPQITKAAIEHEGKIYEGRRHSEIIQRVLEDEGIELGSSGQGFITEYGDFVDRKLAAQIAFSTRQIPDRVSQLTSEDVW